MSLSMADAHLISMRPEMTGIVVPGKLYGVMAAGRPAIFVGPRHCESADTIRTAGCGITVDRGDVDGLVAALEHLAGDPAWRGGWASGAGRRFSRATSGGICCGQWHELIAELTDADAGARRPRDVSPSIVPSHARRPRRWPPSRSRRISAERSFSRSRCTRPIPHGSLRTGTGESLSSLHRPAAGGTGDRRRARGPAAPSRPRPASPRSRPGTTAPRSASCRSTWRPHPKAQRPRPGLRGPLQQGDRARLVRRGRGSRPAVSQDRSRRAGQGAGADHPDDGAGPGRPIRRGACAVSAS